MATVSVDHPMRPIATTALRSFVFIAIALLLILVLLPAAFGAQVASGA